MKRFFEMLALTVLVVVVSPAMLCAKAPLFEGDSVLELKLTAGFAALFEDPQGPREYVPASLEHLKADGGADNVDLSVRLRGKFRAIAKNCSFPPIRLNLKKKSAEGTVFEGQNILKLVTHCKERKNYEQFVLQEYLTYRIWNQVTDKAFKVRLVHVTYVEASDGSEISSRYGILLEHKNALAERLGAEPLKTPRVTVGELDKELIAGMSLFQFLIGNTDWSALRGPDPEDCCHNVELFTAADGKFLTVPYDFDQAGLVNASYSLPAEELQLRSTRVRRYRGYCAVNAELDPWRAAFQDARADIYALFEEGMTDLTDRRRSQSVKYLDTFYRIIDSDSAYKRQIKGRCRN